MTRRPAFAAILIALAGCGAPPIVPAVQWTYAERTTTICLPAKPAIDVLIVVDDSASMQDQAEALANNLYSISTFYDDPGAWVDHRIAVTSTDMGNPACDETTADDGALLLQSCRERRAAFTLQTAVAAEGLSTPVDVWWPGCDERCPYARVQTIPTALHDEGPLRSRPWIERIDGRSNLPAWIDPREALRCIGALGVSGCAYESPLAATRRAIERSLDPEDPGFGFLRPHAALLILFITDEDDCSVRAEQADAFEPGGSRALWSDPTADEPTSAACWHAGVLCDGDPSRLDACRPVDRDLDGAIATPDDAVLEPIDEHLALYRTIAQSKRPTLYDAAVPAVFVRRINGLTPDGFEQVLSETIDPRLSNAFGRGPACEDDERTAFPAPRLQQLVASFPEDPGTRETSICDDDWTPALACLPGGFMRPEPPPMCVEGCLADTDPTIPGRQPQCHVVRSVIDDDGATQEHTMPHCDDAPGDEPCWRIRDSYETPMSPCAWIDRPFEVALEHVADAPRGTCIEATCAMSARPAVDCPEQQ